MDVTNIDLRSLTLSEFTTKDELLTFAGAGTVALGTILARDSVSGEMVPFEIGAGTNESNIPKAVATHDVSAIGAASEACRVLASGEVRLDKLIVHADGDGSNLTAAILDQLRDYGIVATKVDDLSVLDNQP